MHLGKTGYFRSNGIPIPSTVMQSDLQRLSVLIQTYQPEKIIVAGDMFHHDYNADMAIFKAWRNRYAPIEIKLVPGNHDLLADIDYQDLNIRVTPDVYIEEPFVVRHHPSENPSQFEINGHLHPGYILSGKARQVLRLPCFVVTPHQIILPAFSLFTGLYMGYKPHSLAHHFIIVNDEVLKA